MSSRHGPAHADAEGAYQSTETLERLIDLIRRIEGVTRSETMVVLSTHSERTRVALDLTDAPLPRRRRPPRPRREESE